MLSFERAGETVRYQPVRIRDQRQRHVQYLGRPLDGRHESHQLIRLQPGRDGLPVNAGAPSPLGGLWEPGITWPQSRPNTTLTTITCTHVATCWSST